jgi:hypothetical protein
MNKNKAVKTKSTNLQIVLVFCAFFLAVIGIISFTIFYKRMQNKQLTSSIQVEPNFTAEDSVPENLHNGDETEQEKSATIS